MGWARRAPAGGGCPPPPVGGSQARLRGDKEAELGWASAPTGSRIFLEIR